MATENEITQIQITKKTGLNYHGDPAGKCPTEGSHVRFIFYVLQGRQPVFLVGTQQPRRSCA